MSLFNYRKPLNKASYFLIGYHLCLLAAFPWYFTHCTVQVSTIILSIVLLYITGLSITGGYHRLFSHRAYKVHPVVEAVVLFFSAATAQGSALRWSYDHRIHHAFVDTDNDPYSIKKGFWYAHCFWLLDAPREIDPKVVPDLMSNRLVMFQHNYYRTCLVVSNFMIYMASAYLLNDWWGAFFFVIWARIFALHHFTWFINSLAHTWGDKPFCQEQTAVNNFVISLLTFGEGYHNYHHTFANDYRNGIRWYHYDPTKWLIWTMSKLGLASGLKMMDPYLIEKRMVVERKNLLMNRIKDVWSAKKDELEKAVDEVSERMLALIGEYKTLQEKYLECKKLKLQDDLKEISVELKKVRLKIKSDWKLFKQLSFSILNNKPVSISQ